MTNRVDVDATGGNIGCNQYPAGTGGETAKGLLAGILRFIAVEGIGQDTDVIELHRYLIGTVLCAGEDNDTGKRRIFQNIDQ